LASIKNTLNEKEPDSIDALEIIAEMLFQFYVIGINKINIPPVEKMTIGPLIFTSLFSIGYFIDNAVAEFEPETIDELQVQRSGLQFMFEMFGSFPANDTEVLESYFEKFKMQNVVTELDDLLERNKICYSDDGKQQHPTSEFQMFNGVRDKVPATHKWWYF
jgi:hypothetical protein